MNILESIFQVVNITQKQFSLTQSSLKTQITLLVLKQLKTTLDYYLAPKPLRIALAYCLAQKRRPDYFAPRRSLAQKSKIILLWIFFENLAMFLTINGEKQRTRNLFIENFFRMEPIHMSLNVLETKNENLVIENYFP